MKVMGKSAAYVVAASMVLGGCQLFKPSTSATSATAPPAPVQYTPASQGLPTSKIWKSQIAFGDVNGDGFPDIGAVSRLADGPYIWVGDGKGHWTDFSEGLPRESFCGGGMAFGDVNNDGKMDVAIADHCRGTFVYLGDGAGHWKSASAGLPTIGAEDVTVGDFNNDGCLDLAIVAAAEEGVRAFLGNCKGVWKESSKGLARNEWGQAIVAGDIDGDGNVDLAAAYSAGPRVWLGDGKGSWREASEGLPAPDIHGLYQGIALGDVNGDGKLDIAAGTATTGAEVYIQESGPNGPKWRPANDGIIPMNVVFSVALGDLNNDGHVDLVAAGKTALDEIGGVYGVHAFLGDGAGHWKLMENDGLPATGKEKSWGVALADVNKDGVLDIGVAFGDVLSPAWHSGPKATKAKIEDADKKDEKKADKDEKKVEKKASPQRGMYGSIAVWFGELTHK